MFSIVRLPPSEARLRCDMGMAAEMLSPETVCRQSAVAAAPTSAFKVSLACAAAASPCALASSVPCLPDTCLVQGCSQASCAQGYCLGAALYGAIMFSLPFSVGLASQALNLPVRPGPRVLH